MADDTVGVKQAATPDKLIDNSSLTVGANVVDRQRINLADPAKAKGIAQVTDGTAPIQTNVGMALVTPGPASGAGADVQHRLRVANPTSVIANVHTYDLSPLYWDSILVGGASIAHVANQSATNLTVTAASGDSVKWQTHNYIRYTPGQSLHIEATGIPGSPVANQVGRFGYYDDANGFYFENAGAGAPGVTTPGLAVVWRTSTSGSVVNTRVEQASWNVDHMDGTGPSGVTLTPADIQTVFVDFDWRGVIRFGFRVAGQQIICHTMSFNNAITVPQIGYPSLPVRYELTNTGAASGKTMVVTTAAVLSEGAPSDLYTQFSVTNGTTTRAVSAGTYLPLISIRNALLFQGITNRCLSEIIDAHCYSDSTVAWRLILNPTLTGASWSAVGGGTYSSMEFDVSAASYTGGVEQYNDFNAVAKNASASTGLSYAEKTRKMSLNAAGTVGDIITLAAAGIGAGANVSASLMWLEQH
jgi:hypothetical protein